MSLAVVKKQKSTIIIAWIAPILALIISISMSYDYYKKVGNTITITFNNINGLSLRKSHLQFNGIRVGDIKSMKIDPNNINKFILVAQIEPQYNYMIKKGTKFWIVSPTLSLKAGASSLDTILTGNYIEILPPTLDLTKLNSLEKEDSFIAQDHKPNPKGVTTTLISKSGTLGINTFVIYKGMRVGEIISQDLRGYNVEYKVLIYEKYKHLISSKSKFYKISPLEIKASFEEFKLNISSFQEILSSGISFITNEKYSKIKDTYQLYESLDDTNYNTKVINLFTKSKNNFKYLYFKSKKIGKVVSSGIDINSSQTNYKVKIKASYCNLLKQSPYFYIKKSIFSPTNLDIKSTLSGNQLTLHVDSNKIIKPQLNYLIHELPPKEYGYRFELLGNDIKSNDIIFYKGVKVGIVESVTIDTKSNIINAFIDKKYQSLINNSTLFYKIDAITSKVSMDGIELNVAPIKEILQGGISFITPKKDILNQHRFSLYKSKQDINKKRTFNIKIALKKELNIKKSSQLFYKNIKIGEVKEILLDNKEDIVVTLSVDLQYKMLFGKNSKIYAKGESVSIDNLQNISSLITGGNFYLVADSNNGIKLSYKLDSIDPCKTKYLKGLRVLIETKSSKNLSIGSPIYYRNFEIGQIESIDLSLDAKTIILSIFIYKKYAHIIRENSIFYRAKTIDVKIGFLNAELKMGSMKSMLKGGIAVVTPQNPKSKVKDKASFILKDEFKDKWKSYNPLLK